MGTIGAAHFENVTGDMTPSDCSWSSLSSTLDLRAKGSDLGLKIRGWVSGSISILTCVPSNFPNSLQKTVLCWSRTSWSVLDDLIAHSCDQFSLICSKQFLPILNLALQLMAKKLTVHCNARWPAILLEQQVALLSKYVISHQTSVMVAELKKFCMSVHWSLKLPLLCLVSLIFHGFQLWKQQWWAGTA